MTRRRAHPSQEKAAAQPEATALPVNGGIISKTKLEHYSICVGTGAALKKIYNQLLMIFSGFWFVQKNKNTAAFHRRAVSYVYFFYLVLTSAYMQ